MKTLKTILFAMASDMICLFVVFRDLIDSLGSIETGFISMLFYIVFYVIGDSFIKATE